MQKCIAIAYLERLSVKMKSAIQHRNIANPDASPVIKFKIFFYSTFFTDTGNIFNSTIYTVLQCGPVTTGKT